MKGTPGTAVTGNSCVPFTQRTGKEGRELKSRQAGVAGIKTELRTMTLLSRGSRVRTFRHRALVYISMAYTASSLHTYFFIK